MDIASNKQKANQMEKIERFFGEYFFLNKWYPIGVEFGGLKFLSSEAAISRRDVRTLRMESVSQDWILQG